MTCTHDLAEIDTACEDGFCPLCLAKDVKEIRGRIPKLCDDAIGLYLEYVNQHDQDEQEARESVRGEVSEMLMLDDETSVIYKMNPPVLTSEDLGMLVTLLGDRLSDMHGPPDSLSHSFLQSIHEKLSRLREVKSHGEKTS